MTSDDAPSVLAVFLAAVAAAPRAPLIHFVTAAGTETLTRGDIAGHAGVYRRLLHDEEATLGSVALIFLPHTPHLYGAFLGAMAAGLVPSFMPCPSAKQEPGRYWAAHAALLDRIQPGALITDRKTLADMRSAGLKIGCPVLVAEDVDLTAAPAAPTLPLRQPLALLQHSSGTTGLKKGVALTQDNVLMQVQSYSKSLSLNDNDVIVSWLPLYHDMGLAACFLMPVITGTPVVHIDPFHWLARPTLLLDLVDEHRGTLVWMPNFAFDHLTNVARGDWRLSFLRALINCSEPCRAATFERFGERFGVPAAAMQCCYAMAEATFAVTQTRLGEPPVVRAFRKDRLTLDDPVEDDDATGVRLLSCGTCIEGAEVSIRDAAGGDVPDRTVGRIFVRGPFVFQGYFRNPELTAERLNDSWYDTRDIGFRDRGELFVLGRSDDVIICNGKNIFAHDVEEAIEGVVGLKAGRCIALALDDPRSGTQQLAVLAERDDGDPVSLKDATRAIMSRVFTAVAVSPRVVELLPPGWLVKTTSGKLGRAENLKKYLEWRMQDR